MAILTGGGHDRIFQEFKTFPGQDTQTPQNSKNLPPGFHGTSMVLNVSTSPREIRREKNWQIAHNCGRLADLQNKVPTVCYTWVELMLALVARRRLLKQTGR